MSRYDGMPFLRFLDSYVLHAIGHLGRGQDETLQNISPKLAKTLGVSGSWQEIVAAQMDLPSDFPDRINRIWLAGEEKARTMGYSVDPEEFARQFVDKNFANYAVE